MSRQKKEFSGDLHIDTEVNADGVHQQPESKVNTIWKTIAWLLIILGIIGVIAHFTLAIDGNMKSQLCSAANFTFAQCTDFWTTFDNLQAGNSGSSNATVYVTVPVTNITQTITYNLTTDTTQFINREEFDARMKLAESNIKAEVLPDLFQYAQDHKLVQNTTVYVQPNVTMNADEYVTTAAFLKWQADKSFTPVGQVNNNQQVQTQKNDYLPYYVAGILALLIIGYYVWKNGQKPQPVPVQGGLNAAYPNSSAESTVNQPWREDEFHPVVRKV